MPRTVVAAAILERGRVLAARRTSPPAAAGRWELPGGKVEPGEDPAVALVREIGEELGCLVEVLDWLPGRSPIGGTETTAELVAATARISAGEPRPREHDQLRWLGADDLDSVDWLEPDRPFLEPLRRLLAPEPDAAQARRAILFSESDADAVAAALIAAGWRARVRRERYQGEDDDEDHPWAVETDAAELVLELLVDEYDGWLDVAPEEPDASRAPEPIDLPTQPKRITRE
ncbi:MAG: (deoxy)nucleoside triphosphate pyrophosphohydrolase [Nocardioides sp.]|uniref:(deoxy)nucleoside triphosphate pyrophosphohydrolase n=1 Tax=Nocardioides sp. TaxID=35761 RepID=UPI0039E5409B